MTSSQPSIFFYSKNDNSATEQLLQELQLGYKRSTSPLKDILLTVDPLCLIIESADTDLIEFGRFCLQSNTCSLVTAPCSKDDILEGVSKLSLQFEPWVKNKLQAPTYDVPRAVLTGSAAPSELVDDEERVEQLKSDPQLLQVTFNVWSYTPNELVILAATLYERALERVSVHVDFDRLVYLCLVLRACYGFKGYHCFRHIVDVTQYIYFLTVNGLCYYNSDEPLSGVDCASLIISALGHDLLHPTVTTPTVQQLNSKWAQKYRCLEVFHYTVYDDLLKHLLPEALEIAGLEQTMEQVILASEMARHQEFLNNQLDSTAKGKLNFLCLVFKLADIGNCSRIFDSSIRQTVHLGIEIAGEQSLRRKSNLGDKQHFVTSSECYGLSRQEVWQRLQRDQVFFAEAFYLPILDRLMGGKKGPNEKLLSKFKTQYTDTTNQYKEPQCPHGFFF